MFGELKYQFIRTPLERPLIALRRAMMFPQKLSHPEMGEIYREDDRITAVLRRILRPHSNCLDIGAHYGSMLSMLVRNCPLGQHVAVEAIPNKANFLRKKFPEVQIYNVALSKSSGETNFYVNMRRSGFSGLGKHGNSSDRFKKIEVRCETLDQLGKTLKRVDFIKIDVEGAEELVLDGGRKFIGKHRPPILFECGPSGAMALGRKPEDLFDLFAGPLNYDVYLLKNYLAGDKPCERNEFINALQYPFQAFNWIASPKTTG